MRERVASGAGTGVRGPRARSRYCSLGVVGSRWPTAASAAARIRFKIIALGQERDGVTSGP